MGNASRTGRPVLAASAFLLIAAGLAQAAAVPIVNFSFEDPPQGEVGFTDFNNGANPNAIPGWTITGGGNAGVFNPGTGQYPGQGATDGSQVAFSNGGNIISQAVGVLQADTAYTLQVDLGDRTDTPFPTYTIDLFAGGMQLATGSAVTPPDGGFATSTLTFNPGSSHPALGAVLQVRLISDGVQANFDNVRLDATPIPEPAAGFALVAAASGLGLLRRRRRN